MGEELVNEAEISAMLRAFAGAGAPSPSDARTRRPYRVLAISAAVVLVTGAAAGAWLALRGSDHGQPALPNRSLFPPSETRHPDCRSTQAKGAEFVTVPDFRPDELGAAFRQLRRQGLRVNVNGTFTFGSFWHPEVFAQNPRPGTRLAPGAVVTLQVRPGFFGLMGANDKTIEMPDVTHLSLSDAAERLHTAGLAWVTAAVPALTASTACDVLDAYRVIGQEPAAGTPFRQAEQHQQANGDTEARLRPAKLIVEALSG